MDGELLSLLSFITVCCPGWVGSLHAGSLQLIVASVGLGTLYRVVLTCWSLLFLLHQQQPYIPRPIPTHKKSSTPSLVY
ncbi:hypothetical protein V8C44DRAFT_286671 [Trichoderma aethiopicum]